MQVCPPGLHIMLGLFTKMFHLLEALWCQLDLELASHTTEFDYFQFFQVQPGTAKASLAPRRP